MPTIPITINNKIYDISINASILQACEQIGIHVPRFCYHEKLPVAGNCRICLVEVEKSPKPVVSCAMPISKGMIIFTETPLVKKVRESVLEFLLINHPLDCPICDQGGECDLQDETLEYGSDRGRYYDFKRTVEDKEVGPIIKTIMTRCIHCTRCVRFSAEIAGQEVMGSFGRGEETEIGTYVQEFIKTELSGNLADICPVGALTSKPYAFKTRSWELQKVESIDNLDAMCTDIVIQTKKSSKSVFNRIHETLKVITKEEIIRILPKNNSLYEENWISDKTRHAYDGLYNQRLKETLANNNIPTKKNITNGQILLELLSRLYYNPYNSTSPIELGTSTNNIQKKAPLKIGVLVDSGIDLESLYYVNETLKYYGNSNIQYGNFKSNLNFDTPNFYTINTKISNLSSITALLLIGTNPRMEASLLNTALRRQQISRDLPYFSLGAYSDLKMKNEHFGTTQLKMLDLLNNKVKVSETLINTKGTSIFLGAECLKGRNGFSLQTLTRNLAKKLHLKTKEGERLGILHMSPANLMFNFLGVTSNVRSSFNVEEIKDKKLNLLFAIQPFELNKKTWSSSTLKTEIFSFSTHKPNQFRSDFLIPIKSLYEKNGYLINVEGRIRKFYKSVTSPEKLLNLDSFFITILRSQSVASKWLTTLTKFYRFIEESALIKNLNKINLFPTFFVYNFKESGNVLRKGLFPRTIKNFYATDLISLNSPTMGESSLFLNKNRNFI